VKLKVADHLSFELGVNLSLGLARMLGHHGAGALSIRGQSGAVEEFERESSITPPRGYVGDERHRVLVDRARFERLADPLVEDIHKLGCGVTIQHQHVVHEGALGSCIERSQEALVARDRHDAYAVWRTRFLGRAGERVKQVGTAELDEVIEFIQGEREVGVVLV